MIDPRLPDPRRVTAHPERAAYAEGKRAAEMLCAIYAKQFGLDMVNARIFAVLGPLLSLDIQEGLDLVEAAEERLHDPGVEVGTGILGYVSSRALGRPCLLVRSLRRERIEDVRYRNNPKADAVRRLRELIAVEAPWLTIRYAF